MLGTTIVQEPSTDRLPLPLATPAADPRRRSVPTAPRDVVDAAIDDSFPASDPPGWWAGG